MEETYSGNYIVVFDPIDGSANIDISLTTGSIFGIYGPDEQCLVDIDDNSTVILSFCIFCKQMVEKWIQTILNRFVSIVNLTLLGFPAYLDAEEPLILVSKVQNNHMPNGDVSQIHVLK